jgi:hypothetical protein
MEMVKVGVAKCHDRRWGMQETCRRYRVETAQNLVELAQERHDAQGAQETMEAREEPVVWSVPGQMHALHFVLVLTQTALERHAIPRQSVVPGVVRTGYGRDRWGLQRQVRHRGHRHGRSIDPLWRGAETRVEVVVEGEAAMTPCPLLHQLAPTCVRGLSRAAPLRRLRQRDEVDMAPKEAWQVAGRQLLGPV